MRVVSQSKKTDMQYENIIMERVGREIMVCGITFAEYSTEEKAIEAMGKCRRAYAEYKYNYAILPELVNSITRLPKDMITEAQEQLAGKVIFYFPQDEEMNGIEEKE